MSEISRNAAVEFGKASDHLKTTLKVKTPALVEIVESKRIKAVEKPKKTLVVILHTENSKKNK
jgi:hypothetical protein